MRFFQFLFFILVLSLCFYGHANAKPISVSDHDTVIVITPFPNPTDPPIPRSPAVVPISAQYDSFASSVFLTFTSNLGEIEVEVMNTTNGYYDSGDILTLTLYAIIPISGGSGHYIITFTLSSGQQYRGEFDK